MSMTTNLDLIRHERGESTVTSPCLSVVIPCFNEQDTVAEAVNRVLKKGCVAEVIIVDDASDDNSWQVISQLSDQRIRLARHSFNLGKGAAIALGISMATSQFTVIQDADLEYNPDEYDLLLEPLLTERADVVYGSRFHTDRPHRVLYYWHSVGNKLLTIASNMASNINLTDMETCYKMGRTDLMQSLDLREDRFGVEPEMTLKLARRGARIYEVGISYDGRTYDEGKKIGWRDGVRALYCIVKYRVASQAVSSAGAPAGESPAGKPTAGDRLEGSTEPDALSLELIDLTSSPGEHLRPLATDNPLASPKVRRIAERIKPAVGHSDGCVYALELPAERHHQQALISDASSLLKPEDLLIVICPVGSRSWLRNDRAKTLGTLRRMIARSDLVLERLCHGDPLRNLQPLIASGDGAMDRRIERLASSSHWRTAMARLGQRVTLPIEGCVVCLTRVSSRS